MGVLSRTGENEGLERRCSKGQPVRGQARVRAEWIEALKSNLLGTGRGEHLKNLMEGKGPESGNGLQRLGVCIDCRPQSERVLLRLGHGDWTIWQPDKDQG